MMEEQNFTIKYSFSDLLRKEPLGDDPNDFVNKIEFEVYVTDIYRKLSEIIAKGEISQILFGLAMDYNYPLFDVMDASESILDMSGVLFEFEEDKNFWDKIDAYFVDTTPINYTICYLEYLEIVPTYRGKGIGKRIIKSMMERFYDSCGLWVVKGFPIQHSGVIQKQPLKIWTNGIKKWIMIVLKKTLKNHNTSFFTIFNNWVFKIHLIWNILLFNPFKFWIKKCSG